jgi:hypothetical protein
MISKDALFAVSLFLISACCGFLPVGKDAPFGAHGFYMTLVFVAVTIPRAFTPKWVWRSVSQCGLAACSASFFDTFQHFDCSSFTASCDASKHESTEG